MSKTSKTDAPSDLSPSQNPEAGQARFLEGWAFHQRGDLARAGDLYRHALELSPGHFDALHLLGIVAVQTGGFDQAVAWIGQAIAVDPRNPVAHFNHGIALEKRGRLADAGDSFERAIRLKADYADAYACRGNVFLGLFRYDEAIESYSQALRINPDAPGFHYQRANALRLSGRNQEAVASYDQALQIKPDFTEAYIDRGISLWRLGQIPAAIDSYDQAIALKPNLVEAHINRGVALRSMNRLPEALASFNRAILLNPHHAGAHNNRGTALTDLGNPAGALADFERAIQLQPGNADAHNNRGAALSDLGRHEAALASFDKAIALNPTHADAHFNRGNALKELRRFEAAIASYDRCLTFRPDGAFVRGTRLHTKMQICDWRDLPAELSDLAARIERGETVSPPFCTLAALESPRAQRAAAEVWTLTKNPKNDVLGAIPARAATAKIRIGYFSADFRDHPVAALLAGLIESHDRRQFEVYAYSFGPDTRDPTHIRLMGAFDKFIDVARMSDREIAELARRMELDIAVDLAGYTADARMRVFAMRIAPVQVGFLGYPGTTGLETIDYLVADCVVIPAESRNQYSEKIIALPCLQPNDDARKIAAVTPSRRDLGLPEQGFVYCCFNNTYKITPATFDVWMRILKRVEDSVLWLSDANAVATRNLRAEAERRGVHSARLIFAPRVSSLEEHLARQRAADLFLDTRPYNAHTTASDALWAGLPVLTWPTAGFAGRVAASLLTALDLPELIAPTAETFETLAIELAEDPGLLAHIRQKLEHQRRTSSLFNTNLYARHIEMAYRQIHDRARSGLPPDHIQIAI